MILARLHGLAASANALTAGLPLEQGRLTAALFERAAQRLDLASRPVRRPLDGLDRLVTPAVLLLKDGDACVLLDPVDNGQARVVLPDNPDGHVELPAAELAERYVGTALLVSPRHRYDARTPATKPAVQGHWFWGVIGESWRIYRDVLLASVLVNAFALVGPLFIMNVYDRVVPNQALETLWVLAIGVLVVYLFDFLLRTLRGRFVDQAGARADIKLSSALYERVLGLRMDSRPSSVGAFAQNLREFESIRDFFTSLTLTALVDLPFALLFLLVVWFIAGPLVLVPLAAIPLLIGYGLFIQPRIRHAAEHGMRAAAQKNATLVEGLQEAETVKALGVEGRLQRQLESAAVEGARWGAEGRMWGLSAASVATLVQQLASVGVVIAGVYLIADGALSLGALIAAVILSGRALGPLAQLAGLMTRYHQAATALDSLNRVMALPVERPAGKVFVARPVLRGELQFDHVTFRYPGQEVAALNDASFRIAAGERVAVIGRIGSGKTTVNRLIAGLYQASEGAVRVDGVDIRQIDPADLRRNVAYVSQDSQLLFGSVRDNLTMGVSGAEDEQILRAAQLSGVAGFVNQHPLGFDMPVGEHGSMLSGGQRQAVALARALVQDPPVLLLDEPTGSMDNSSEEHIKRSLAEVVPGKTLVLITHRASLLSLVERVIVLDEGRVVADGPRDQVLEALRAGRIKQSN